VAPQDLDDLGATVGLAQVAHRVGGRHVGDLHHRGAPSAQESKLEPGEATQATLGTGRLEQQGRAARPRGIRLAGLPLAEALGKPAGGPAATELGRVHVRELVPRDHVEVVTGGAWADRGDGGAEANTYGTERARADGSNGEVFGSIEDLEAGRPRVDPVGSVEGVAGLGELRVELG